MKLRVIFIVTMSVLVISTIATYHVLNNSNNKKPRRESNTNLFDDTSNSFSSPSSYSTSTYYPSTSVSNRSDTTSNLPDKEELTKPPQRRPIQYIHVCKETSSSTIYVTQGKPDCLSGGVFQFDYSTNVAGVVYSTPCKTTDGSSSKLRYVYISENGTCPAGTEAVR